MLLVEALQQVNMQVPGFNRAALEAPQLLWRKKPMPKQISLHLNGTNDGPVVRVGAVATKLKDAASNALIGPRDAQSLANSIESLEALSLMAESIHLDQPSLIANTNLVEILRIQAGIRLTIAAAQSALAREESRGHHHRSDFPEQDESFLHHTTVDQTGATSTIGLRKGAAGNWVLPPQ